MKISQKVIGGLLFLTHTVNSLDVLIGLVGSDRGVFTHGLSWVTANGPLAMTGAVVRNSCWSG